MLLGSCAWRSAKAKREAVLVLAEDIALDDPFAEMTAPAEAKNIVKEDELSPDPTDFQDVFVWYHSFLCGYSIRSLNGFKEKVLSHHLFNYRKNHLCIPK